jgi:hypothetical protein
MPKWLQAMLTPTVALCLYVLAFAVVSALESIRGDLPKLAELASRIALPFIIATWVLADADKRGRRLFYDYGSFVFFAWPVMVPIYLFQTRGWRALITMLYFAGLWVAYAIVTAVLSSVFQGVLS